MRLALFDLDDTLFTGDSDYEWVELLIDRGVLQQIAHARSWPLLRLGRPPDRYAGAGRRV